MDSFCIFEIIFIILKFFFKVVYVTPTLSSPFCKNFVSGVFFQCFLASLDFVFVFVFTFVFIENAELQRRRACE